MIKEGIEKTPKLLYDALLGALGPLGDLLPHSPAKEGPLSQDVNFIAYLVDPLNAAVALMNPITGTIGGIFDGIINTITGKTPDMQTQSSLMFGTFSDEVKKAGENLSPEMQGHLDDMLNDIGSRNPDMSEKGQAIMNEFLLQVQQNGGKISPEMISSLNTALTDVDAKSPDFSDRGKGLVDNVLAGINLDAPKLLAGAQGLVDQIMDIFGGVKTPDTSGTKTEVQPIQGNQNYKEPIITQPVQPTNTDLISSASSGIHIANVDDSDLQVKINPNQYTAPIGPTNEIAPVKSDWTDIITNPINDAITIGQNIIGDFIGGIGNLLPHSLAKEGPLSVAPDWTSILNDPLEESASKMNDPILAGANEIAKTLNKKITVGITPEIDTMGLSSSSVPVPGRNIVSPTSLGIMPGPKQDTVQPVNQQTIGGNTYIMQMGGVTIKSEQDLESLFKKFEAFVAGQLPGQGILS